MESWFRRAFPLFLVVTMAWSLWGQDEGPRIGVKEFKFSGNTVIATSDLDRLVQPFVGKDLTLQEIKDVAGLITRAYRERGYVLAWAFVPPQDIKKSGGDVEIAIVEVKVDRVVVQGNRHYDTDFILSHLSGVSSQSVFQNDDVERGLLLLDGYLSLSARSTLRPGSKPGTTDVTIDVMDSRPVVLTLTYDNLGNDSVSEHRIGASFEIGNLWNSGHELSIRAVMGTETENLRFATLGYRAPLSSDGFRFDASIGWMEYVVGEDIPVLEPTGNGLIYSAGLSYLLSRTRKFSCTVQAGFAGRDIEQFLLDTLAAEDHVRAVYGGVLLEVEDSWNGRMMLSFEGRLGLGSFLGGTTEDDEASREEASNTFTKFSLALHRMQRISDELYAVIKVSGQYSPDSLLVSEQIGIGGVDSVRGYNYFEYAGDWGYTAGLELRIVPPGLSELDAPFTGGAMKIADVLNLACFIDHGEVWLHNPRVNEAESTSLQGCGVGIRIKYPVVSISVDVGFPLSRIDPRTREDVIFYVQVSVGLDAKTVGLSE